MEYCFLGYVVSRKCIEMDKDKFKAIKKWPTPKTMSEVINYHGLASFNRIFIKDFSTISALLTKIIKNIVGFLMGNETRERF